MGNLDAPKFKFPFSPAFLPLSFRKEGKLEGVSSYGAMQAAGGCALKGFLKMAFTIITIPFNPVTKSFHPVDLNRFCLNKNILTKKVEFFKDGEAVYWSVFIEYETVLEETGRETSGLTQAGKLCYEKLRAWRKETAEKQGIPPFVIAKNSQLIEITNKEIATLEGLKQINGFGKKKLRNTAKT